MSEPTDRTGATAAHQVETIIAAAESAAEELLLSTEASVRARIAEGDRAAENRVKAAEEEAAELLKDAHEEAEQATTVAASEALAIVAKAHEDADHTREQAAEALTAAKAEAAEIVRRARAEADEILAKAKAQSLEIIVEARIAASDVRAEGTELVGNLREMGDSLRANSERLLRDVQAIHSHLVARLDRVDGGASRASIPLPAAWDSGARSRPRSSARDDDGEELDVPEFIPPG